MQQNFWMQEGTPLPSEREHRNVNLNKLAENSQSANLEQPKIKNIDEELNGRLGSQIGQIHPNNGEVKKNNAKFKYDPEVDAIVRIKKELAFNDDLKRVTFESDGLHEEINRQFG